MPTKSKRSRPDGGGARPDARPELTEPELTEPELTETEASERESAEPRLGKSRLIKRYANRKLYDTHSSRYVTLQEVGALVREGEEVRIVDNRDQSDLTDVTLAQILYEEQKRGAEGRSVRALRGLIQRGERLITTLARPARPESDGEEEPAHRRFPISEIQRFADDRVRQVLAAAMAHVGELQGEVTRLQARIEVLEGKLRRFSGRSSKATRTEAEARNVAGAEETASSAEE